MNIIENLVLNIAASRASFLEEIDGLSELEANWKPAPEVWNIVEITEHLYWAEQGGIAGMWKTLYGIREGKIKRTFESIHKEMPVLDIISLTWKEKEIVPAVAAPRVGGPLSLWIANLQSLQQVLNAFSVYIKEDELRLRAHPHPISGEIDFHQRLEFLTFHLDRHRHQATKLIDNMRQVTDLKRAF